MPYFVAVVAAVFDVMDVVDALDGDLAMLARAFVPHAVLILLLMIDDATDVFLYCT
jgi:hypothetical protein